MYFDFQITSSKPLSVLARSKHLFTWQEALEYVKCLPYGRNKSRSDFSLVLKEEKGSCSSKHAFLKALANENKAKDVELILAIYKMNSDNTNIGDVISSSGLSYIPEAHCYLKINGERIDITSKDSSLDKIEKMILSEESISPEQVVTYKVEFHKSFLKNWIKNENINSSFEKVWKVREACISFLTNSKK
ncbi:conserved hypothetical protein [Tenacibaculum sp. 190524A05c]|uniref:hypothetical protein n=1 Tax=Tenacibaculum platacis TaxID=3137852 RepID=UPI0031FAF907